MEVLLGYVWATVGGIVAGRVLYLLYQDKEDLIPALIISMLAWICWPVAWSFLHASKQGKKPAKKESAE